MNPFSSSTNTNKKHVVNKAEIVGEKEPQPQKTAGQTSLRELPKHVVDSFTTDVIGGVLDGFTMQLLGQPLTGPERPNQPQADTNVEALVWKKKFLHAERRRQEERALLLEKQRQTEQKLVSIRQELQVHVATLNKEVVSWAQEVEIASFQAPADPGIYHQNFFEQLISFVKNLRQRINNSKLWLRTHNTKAVKKKGLWGLAQKGNTYNQEILFSGERAISMNG